MKKRCSINFLFFSFLLHYTKQWLICCKTNSFSRGKFILQSLSFSLWSKTWKIVETNKLLHFFLDHKKNWKILSTKDVQPFIMKNISKLINKMSFFTTKMQISGSFIGCSARLTGWKHFCDGAAAIKACQFTMVSSMRRRHEPINVVEEVEIDILVWMNKGNGAN